MTSAQQRAKQVLHRYLRQARKTMVWKTSELSEYDVRRPLTPTGTNLLGLAKHLTVVELLYFSVIFDRPFDEPVEWFGEHVEPGVDMWARPDESREYVLGMYRRAGEHADATIESLELDATGFIPWAPEPDCFPTLRDALVHVLAEVQRHLGHADIVRELVDGAVGLCDRSVPSEVDEANDVRDVALGDASWWVSYRDTVQRAAREATQVRPST